MPLDKGTGFQSFPYPNDVVEFSDEDQGDEAHVKVRKNKDLTFVEGDELVALLTAVATELYERGQPDLAISVADTADELGGF